MTKIDVVVKSLLLTFLIFTVTIYPMLLQLQATGNMLLLAMWCAGSVPFLALVFLKSYRFFVTENPLFLLHLIIIVCVLECLSLFVYLSLRHFSLGSSMQMLSMS